MLRDTFRNLILCVAVYLFLIGAPSFALAQRNLESADELRVFGRRAYEEGRYKEAEELLRRALEIVQPGSPETRDKLAQTLGDLASALIAQERYEEAEQLLH